jgi:hypothetical protein
LPLQLPGTEAIGGQSWRENPWENIGKTWENNGKKNTLPSGKLSHNYGKSSFLMGIIDFKLQFFKTIPSSAGDPITRSWPLKAGDIAIIFPDFWQLNYPSPQVSQSIKSL